ncbi:MAG TPA: FGGY-family carbohydrate kinase, partial [Chloroflexia bacterium]|nr:FGGY-family carbohydrate kinase [Chloroflexia bacterium]
DAHGLTILPHIAGERSPGWNGSARGAIMGLSFATNKAHIVRGVQEAVALRLGLVFERLEGALPGVDKIVASGGALLTSTGWLQIVADVIGRPITASMEEEASSKGAAMMAFRSLGLVQSFEELPAALGKTYLPNMDNHQVYRRASQRQQQLYARMHDHS